MIKHLLFKNTLFSISHSIFLFSFPSLPHHFCPLPYSIPPPISSFPFLLFEIIPFQLSSNNHDYSTNPHKNGSSHEINKTEESSRPKMWKKKCLSEPQFRWIFTRFRPPLRSISWQWRDPDLGHHFCFFIHYYSFFVNCIEMRVRSLYFFALLTVLCISLSGISLPFLSLSYRSISLHAR